MEEKKLPEHIRQTIERLKAEHELMKDPNYRRRKQIESLESMKSFNKNNSDHIPDIPRMSKNDYIEYVIPNFIRCGAIPKSELIDGRNYYGGCRNASEAIWHADKNYFTYERHKFGYIYQENINHFEDDNGYDLFVPLKLIEQNESI